MTPFAPRPGLEPHALPGLVIEAALVEGLRLVDENAALKAENEHLKANKPYTEQELIDMLWKLRSAWIAKVIRQADDPDDWLDEMDDEDRQLSREFNSLMHRVTNPHLFTKESEPK